MNKYTPPFRLGRKNKRAVLDSKGLEVVTFKEGDEELAKDYVSILSYSKWVREINAKIFLNYLKDKQIKGSYELLYDIFKLHIDSSFIQQNNLRDEIENRFNKIMRDTLFLFFTEEKLKNKI